MQLTLTDTLKTNADILKYIGKSKLGGSSLRMHSEITNRLDKLTKLESKLKQLSLYTSDSADILNYHRTTCTTFINRLALLIHHNDSQSCNSDWNRYYSTNTYRDLCKSVRLPVAPRSDDITSIHLRWLNLKQRQAYYSQKIHFEIRMASEKKWFMLFDTLDFTDEGLIRFRKENSARGTSPLNTYTKSIARSVKAYIDKNQGKKVLKDCIQSDYYRFCIVPEWGTKNGRLHFHAIHMMRDFPARLIVPGIKGISKFSYVTGLRNDPNFGCRLRNRIECKPFDMIWPYGDITAAIPVRYIADQYSIALGWLRPMVKDKHTNLLTPQPLYDPYSIASYMSKYVTKQTDQSSEKGDQFQKDLYLLNDGRKEMKIRVSKGFGFSDIASMQDLSIDSVKELTRLSISITPYNSLLAYAAKRELKARFIPIPTDQALSIMPRKIDFTSIVRAQLGEGGTPEQLPSHFSKLSDSALSVETINYLRINKYDRESAPKPNYSTKLAGK